VRDGDRCAYRLEATWLPAYEVPATIAPPAGDGTLLAGLELSMEALFVTSANLTQSGVGKNIEAGLLVRGGAAPARAAEYVDALRASGDLIRLN
jgi:hypothetical protein